jgi:cephalosporin hydroxylase
MTVQTLHDVLPPFAPPGPVRPCPEPLEQLFRSAVSLPTDINEHLELLRLLSSQCEHVTEFGMRGGMSTTALLAGQPKTFITWDIDPAAVISQVTANLFNTSAGGRTTFQPRVGNTLEISVIEPTDMLFIDSLHTCKQLIAELVRHADPVTNNVRKYLAFHDTVTFGEVSEDGTEPGLRAALRHFQRNHAFPVWKLVVDRPNNNGLCVLANVRAFP